MRENEGKCEEKQAVQGANNKRANNGWLSASHSCWNSCWIPTCYIFNTSTLQYYELHIYSLSINAWTKRKTVRITGNILGIRGDHGQSMNVSPYVKLRYDDGAQKSHAVYGVQPAPSFSMLAIYCIVVDRWSLLFLSLCRFLLCLFLLCLFPLCLLLCSALGRQDSSSLRISKDKT